jgi:hypothetical protein
MKWFVATDYGLKPAGTVNSAPQLRAMLADINAHVGKFGVLFPPGIYLIDEHRVVGGAGRNMVHELRLDARRCFVISGYGAKLSFAGGFHRSADELIPTGGAPQYLGYDCSLGLVLSGCSEFVIEGLEIDGNAETVSRDAGVVEAYASSGVTTEACDRYVLRDLDIHHTTGDGILIGLGSGTYRRADRGGRLVRVRCWANARNAVTVSQATGMRFTDCLFEDAGRTGLVPHTVGPYGGHAPQASCDIEPDYNPLEHPDVVDRWTGDLVFRGCAFRGSVGAAFSSVIAAVRGRVLLEDCAFDGTTSSMREQVMLTSPLIEVDRCRFVNAPVFGTFSGGEHSRSLLIRGSTMVSRSVAIVIAETDPSVHLTGAIEDNLIVRTEGPFTSSGYPLMVRAGPAPFNFRRNTVILDQSAAADAPAPLPANTYVALLQVLDRVEGNSYSTNLTTVGRTLAVNYDGSTTVRSEQYHGQLIVA